jgi:hypothetical protein
MLASARYWRVHISASARSRRDFEIGRILHLKSEIRNLKLDSACAGLLRRLRVEAVQFEVSDFGFEII